MCMMQGRRACVDAGGCRGLRREVWSGGGVLGDRDRDCTAPTATTTTAAATTRAFLVMPLLTLFGLCSLVILCAMRVLVAAAASGVTTSAWSLGAS